MNSLKMFYMMRNLAIILLGFRLEQKVIFIILRKLTILTLVILLFSGTYSFATDLTGYQAIYNMKLDKATTGSQFSAVHGSAVSYFRRACAGWQAKEELVMDFYTQTGKEQSISWLR